MLKKRSFGRPSKVPSPRKVPDIVMTLEDARKLVYNLFDDAPRNLSNYQVADTGSGVISITSPGGMRGYTIFYPNGTKASADYVGACNQTKKTYQTLGRATERAVDLTRHVAAISWTRGGKR